MMNHGATGLAFSYSPTDDVGPEPRTILVVDEQALYRSALCWALFKAWPGLRIVDIDHQFGLRQRLERTSPSVILLNAQFLAEQTPGYVASLARSAPLSSLILLADDGLRLPSLPSSARVLSRSLPIAGIVEQVDDILNASLDPRRQCSPNQGKDLAAKKQDLLTRSENKVLAAAGAGLLNKQIAFEMGITEATVKAHMSAILRKLGVQNRMQAINLVRRANPVAFPL